MKETSHITVYCKNSQILNKSITVIFANIIKSLEVLRIVWSPKICVFERKENLKQLYDKRYDMYERVVTYEGEEYNCKICKLINIDYHGIVPLRGSNIPQRLQTVANSISQHISNVTFEKVKPNRMILNLKIDSKDRIWLLWCSSLRIEGK